MAVAIREFGLTAPGAKYVLRPGGYAVIFRDAAEVALVSTPQGFFLPGGGQDVDESPEQAAIRESCEECGLRIVLGTCIGVADELVFAADEQLHYRKRCVFFLAKVAENLSRGEPDHQLVWRTPAEALAKLRPESQRWALAEALRQTKQ